MYEAIESAIKEAAAERDLNFDAGITIYPDRILIDTRLSRDQSRSNNGGEYDFWLKIWPHRKNVLVQEFCSCDFWQPQNEPEIMQFTDASQWDWVVSATKGLAEKYNVPVEEKRHASQSGK